MPVDGRGVGVEQDDETPREVSGGRERHAAEGVRVTDRLLPARPRGKRRFDDEYDQETHNRRSDAEAVASRHAHAIIDAL